MAKSNKICNNPSYFIYIYAVFWIIFLQPLNKDDFKTIEIPEDKEVNVAVIGILKYIIS